MSVRRKALVFTMFRHVSDFQSNFEVLYRLKTIILSLWYAIYAKHLSLENVMVNAKKVSGKILFSEKSIRRCLQEFTF